MGRISLLFICLFSLFPASGWAWDLALGLQRTKPQIGYHQQTYQSDAGNWSFKPDGEETIFGQALTLDLIIDWAMIEYEQSEYKTTTKTSDSSGNLVELSPTFTQERLGLYFSAERELAGFFIGGGFDRSKESFDYNGNTYRYEGTSPYAKAGILMIFGPFRVRAEQLHSSIGEHFLKTNSLGLLLQF
ncbi:MAG: hypothetical protein RRB13_15390 [bacterium]|nr:hypothetical protein [bacterium]